MLFAVVCMSARMCTAHICACCDAACARIASVDMRADAVVVHIAPVGVCCDALCACAASVGACCDVAFARTVFVRALCAALNAPSLSVRASVLPPPLVLTAMFSYTCEASVGTCCDAARECTMSLTALCNAICARTAFVGGCCEHTLPVGVCRDATFACNESMRHGDVLLGACNEARRCSLRSISFSTAVVPSRKSVLIIK